MFRTAFFFAFDTIISLYFFLLMLLLNARFLAFTQLFCWFVIHLRIPPVPYKVFSVRYG